MAQDATRNWGESELLEREREGGRERERKRGREGELLASRMRLGTGASRAGRGSSSGGGGGSGEPTDASRPAARAPALARADERGTRQNRPGLRAGKGRGAASVLRERERE
jgi:hypothetical protein